MNEKFEILKSIKKAANAKSKTDGDVIAKLAKTKTKQDRYKIRHIEEWEQSDFLSYLYNLFKSFGIICILNSRRDFDLINAIHDQLVIRFQKKITNKVLKDYFDWWCSTCGVKYSGAEINLRYLTNAVSLSRFASGYQTNVEHNIDVKQENKIQQNNHSIEAIFNCGGISRLILDKGIVVSCDFLMDKNKTNLTTEINNISKHLKLFDNETLLSIIDTTIKLAPYNKHLSFDFVDLVKSMLPVEWHLKLSHIKFMVFFRETKGV